MLIQTLQTRWLLHFSSHDDNFLRITVFVCVFLCLCVSLYVLFCHGLTTVSAHTHRRSQRSNSMMESALRAVQMIGTQIGTLH